MKLSVVVAIVLAGVVLQASAHPAGETEEAEAVADAGSELLVFTGGCTTHALLAQMANLLVTISPKDTLSYRFSKSLLDAIQRHQSGKSGSIEDALTNFIKGNDSYFDKFAILCAAYTAPNVSWRDIQRSTWKFMATHTEDYRTVVQNLLKNHNFGIFSDIIKFLQTTFSTCNNQ